jgi:hypothetical protein
MKSGGIPHCSQDSPPLPLRSKGRGPGVRGWSSRWLASRCEATPLAARAAPPAHPSSGLRPPSPLAVEGGRPKQPARTVVSRPTRPALWPQTGAPGHPFPPRLPRPSVVEVPLAAGRSPLRCGQPREFPPPHRTASRISRMTARSAGPTARRKGVLLPGRRMSDAACQCSRVSNGSLKSSTRRSPASTMRFQSQ